MTRNPFANAAAALAYIIIVVLIMFYGVEQAGRAKSIIIPITVLSLFTLSAAVMAFVFGYQPFVLYFDGKKKEALDLALKTIAAFGGITILILILLFSRVLPL